MHWLKAWLRRWLDVTEDRELIDGQRRDFQRLETELTNTRTALSQAIWQLNQTTGAAFSAKDRLDSYERTVPAIQKIKRASDARRLNLTAAAKRSGKHPAPDEPEGIRIVPPAVETVVENNDVDPPGEMDVSA